MGDVIYSASPFQTFIWAIGLILFLFALGVIGVLMGIFRRREKAITRIARGGSGVILFLAGLALAFVTFRSITAGVETFAARLEDKQVAHDNCGDSETCDRYILEMQEGQNFYDLDVTETAYEKAQVNSCYSVTFYPSGGFFSGSSSTSSTGSYESVSNITSIVSVACP